MLSHVVSMTSSSSSNWTLMRASATPVFDSMMQPPFSIRLSGSTVTLSSLSAIDVQKSFFRVTVSRSSGETRTMNSCRSTIYDSAFFMTERMISGFSEISVLIIFRAILTAF